MRRLAALVIVAALVLAATALAATTDTYRGRTSDGQKTAVTVTDGVVKSVDIPWTASECRPTDGFSVKYSHFFYRGTNAQPIDQRGTRFSDGGRVTISNRDGGKDVIDSHMTGRFSGSKISGTQRITVVRRDRHGRHKCTSSVTWSAKRVSSR